MSQHKQYLEYKMVKAGWLKSLPGHWGLLPLKAIASVELSNVDKKSADGEPEVQLCNYVDVYKNEKITRKITFMQATASPQQIQRLSLEEGDVLLTKDSESPNDIGVPSLVAEPVKAVCGYHLALARPNPDLCDGGFLAWFIRSQPNKAYFETEAKGLTRYGIDKSSIKDTPVAYPPLLEQQQIKSFLDRETARIDTLIAKKTRFIELLKEKRQAVITQAVTQGLDDTVPMKDSGVKWLGMVPAHWVVSKLNFRYSIELGKMLDEKRISGENLLPYLRNQDVQWQGINDKNLPEMDIKANEVDRYTVSRGDLLVCEGGDVGRAALWRGESRVIGFQKALHRVRPRSKIKDTAEFFIHSLRTAKMCGAFEESDTKSTISHLPAERFT